jgi:hypothetical protein
MPWDSLNVSSGEIFKSEDANRLKASQSFRALTFYSAPSSINNCQSNSDCALEFTYWDRIVFPQDLELDSNSKKIPAKDVMTKALAIKPQIKFYGYINLGITNSYDMTEISCRIDGWKEMGAYGIFFDEMGYDFQTQRSRQNEAVGLVHSAGLHVLYNGWDPDDLFGSTVNDSMNPLGLDPIPNSGYDMYMSESVPVNTGAWSNNYRDYDAMKTKQQKILGYKEEYGILSMGISFVEFVDSGGTVMSQHEAHHYDMMTKETARIWGWDAYGVCQYGNSASGAGKTWAYHPKFPEDWDTYHVDQSNLIIYSDSKSIYRKDLGNLIVLDDSSDNYRFHSRDATNYLFADSNGDGAYLQVNCVEILYMTESSAEFNNNITVLNAGGGGSGYSSGDNMFANNMTVGGTLTANGATDVGSIGADTIIVSSAGIFEKGGTGISTASDIYAGTSFIVKNNSYGGSGPSSSGDDFVIESNFSAGMSMLGNGGVCSIYFGDPADNNVGRLLYDLGADVMDFFTGGLRRMRIDSSGDVGIGTSSPSYALELSTDSAGKPSTNTWTIVSDARLKENIELADLDRCVEIIKSLPLKRYTWKDEIYTKEQVEDRSKLGWIADDVEEVFPKSVRITRKTVKEPEEDDEGQILKEGVFIEDCKTLNSDQIYAVMYGALQKALNKIDDLEARIKELEG